jgi:O-antigen/teichoic acid export membrane protein
MTTAQRVLKNSGFLYLRMLLTVFISLYTTRLILAELGEIDFGIFNIVAGTITMLTFLNSTMSSASQRFMSHAQGQGKKNIQTQIFSISVIIHLIVGVIIVILLETASFFIFDHLLNIDFDRVNAAKIIYHFMVISTFFSVITVPYDAVLNAHENMFLVAILGIFEALFKFAIAISITYIKTDKLILYGVLMTLSTVILLVIRRIYCHTKYPEVVNNVFRYFDIHKFKEMMNFAGWSFLSGIASMVTNQGRNLLVNNYFGTTVNAAQAVTSQIVGQLSSFSTVLMQALNPVLVKTEGAGNRDLMFKSAFTGGKLSFFLLFFVSTPIIIEMPFVLNIWLEKVPEYTIEFCRLTLITYTLGQLTLPLITTIGAIGKIKNYQISVSLAAVLPFGISWILYSIGFSPTSLYITYLSFEWLGLSIILYHTKKCGGLEPTEFLKQVYFRSLAIAFLVYFVTFVPHFLIQEGILRFIVVGFSTIISFIIFVYLFGLSKEEKSIITEVIFKIKNSNYVRKN